MFENVELPLAYRGMAASERKQRVPVARALAGKPSILLADEPCTEAGAMVSLNGPNSCN